MSIIYICKSKWQRNIVQRCASTYLSRLDRFFCGFNRWYRWETPRCTSWTYIQNFCLLCPTCSGYCLLSSVSSPSIAIKLTWRTSLWALNILENKIYLLLSTLSCISKNIESEIYYIILIYILYIYYYISDNIKNIARGTTDLGYWVQNLNYL